MNSAAMSSLQKAIELTVAGSCHQAANEPYRAIYSYESAIAYYIEAVGATEKDELVTEISRATYDILKNLGLNLPSTLRPPRDEQERPMQQKSQQNNQTPGAKSSRRACADLAVQHQHALINRIIQTIVFHKPTMTFADVAGRKKEKASLKHAVLSPFKHPELHRSTFKAILLYGAAGTGKSILAKSLAGEIYNCTFFSVSRADLLSIWTGESEALVKLLFQTARTMKPSIIFIDKIDSICERTVVGNGDDSAVNGVLAELCKQMDSSADNNEGVVVLGSTTVPHTLDDVLLGRFHNKLYIPLPCSDTRKELLLSRFKNHEEISSSVIDKVVKLTRGLSMLDIVKLFDAAAGLAIERLGRCTHFRIGTVNGNEMYQPCAATAAGAFVTKLDDIPPNKMHVKLRLTKDDLLQSAKAARNPTDPNSISTLEAFVRNRGGRVASTNRVLRSCAALLRLE